MTNLKDLMRDFANEVIENHELIGMPDAEPRDLEDLLDEYLVTIVSRLIGYDL